MDAAQLVFKLPSPLMCPNNTLNAHSIGEVHGAVITMPWPANVYSGGNLHKVIAWCPDCKVILPLGSW